MKKTTIYLMLFTIIKLQNPMMAMDNGGSHLNFLAFKTQADEIQKQMTDLQSKYNSGKISPAAYSSQLSRIISDGEPIILAVYNNLLPDLPSDQQETFKNILIEYQKTINDEKNQYNKIWNNHRRKMEQLFSPTNK